MKNLILFGDSVFDNGVYVDPGQKDVSAHLKSKLDPLEWSFELRAVDGHVSGHIVDQVSQRPLIKPCTCVLSVGGNNALGYLQFIQNPTSDKSVGSVLLDFHGIKEDFRTSYVNALDTILNEGQPLIVCTIYNPKFPEPSVQAIAEAGLSFFNDVIVEEALKRSLPIIDLREVCSDLNAFANPIEPSEIGGDLITDAIILKISDLSEEQHLPENSYEPMGEKEQADYKGWFENIRLTGDEICEQAYQSEEEHHRVIEEENDLETATELEDWWQSNSRPTEDDIRISKADEDDRTQKEYAARGGDLVGTNPDDIDSYTPD